MHELTTYHFTSDKLSLYSDIGNTTALRRRAKKRDIKVNVVEINEAEGITFDEHDIFFIGGGSDRGQALVTRELGKIKTPLKETVKDGMLGLTVHGGYQLLREKYITPDGTELEGLDTLDFCTESKMSRLIGDIVIESDIFGTIIGFEDHGGKTYHDFSTFGHVTFDYGNNNGDKKEGVHYKNLLGTYLHGPTLPKNYEIADYLLGRACECKGIPFEPKEVSNEAEI